MKSLDLQTTINNLTDAKSNEDAKDGIIGSALSALGMSGENLAKSNEDAKDGIIGSALSGLGMSGENLALLKNICNNAKEKLGIGRKM